MIDIPYLEFDPCISQEAEYDPTCMVASVPHLKKKKNYTFALLRRCSELKH